jgi:hypothetical protein
MTSWGHGGGTQQGSSMSSGYCKTNLFINDTEYTVFPFTYTVSGTVSVAIYLEENGVTANSSVFSKTLTMDDTSPTATVISATTADGYYTGGTWTDKTVTLVLKGTDADGSGIYGFTVNGLQIITAVPVYEYSVTKTETVRYRAVDNVGNEGAWTSFRVNIDGTPPVLSFTADGYEAGTWVKGPVTVGVGAEDDNKVESVTLYADGGVSTGVFSVAEGEAEIYEISAAAADESGKRSSKTFGSVKLDRKAPVIGTPVLTFEVPADGSLMQYLDAAAAVSDAGVNSGLAEITVQYSTVTGSFITAKHTVLSAASVYDCSCRIPLDGIDRSSDKTVYVQFTAADTAGNSSVQTASILLPAAIHASAGAADSRVDGSLIKTKITLGAIHPGSYGAVKYKRDFLAGNIEITEDNFGTYFQENERSEWRNLTEMQTLAAAQLDCTESDGVKTYYYEDPIGSDSGFGHKNIRYTFYETPLNSSFAEYNGGSEAFQLADNKGIITWKITGRDGKELILGADGSESRRDEGFELPANGMVQIAFRVQDYDMEPYRIELKQVTGIDTGDGRTYTLRQPVEGAVSDGATAGCAGKTGSADESGLRIYTDESAGSGDGWVMFQTPVYLSYNKPSCFILTASEGYTGFEYKNETAVIKLTAAAPDLGGFTLSVSTGADYNSGGITVRPYQAAALEIEPVSAESTGTVYGWKFGDGSTASGLSVSHSFKQDPARTGDTSTYTMQITRNSTAAALIPVHVVDTQYGTLYGNETWAGRHVLLGRVTVPAGVTLTIGDKREIEGTDVLCYGDTDKDFQSGIEVKSGGRLVINNGSKQVVVTEMENTGTDGYQAVSAMKYGWGTLYFENGAAASLTNSLIQYADQGLEVCPGAQVSIQDCRLTGNRTGLHIFGGASAVLKGCTVTGNVVYGIKEDLNSTGEKVTITIDTATVISGNGADYYDWDTGVLTAEEIENKKAAER